MGPWSYCRRFHLTRFGFGWSLAGIRIPANIIDHEEDRA
jgi:hypothetical protein